MALKARLTTPKPEAKPVEEVSDKPRNHAEKEKILEEMLAHSVDGVKTGPLPQCSCCGQAWSIHEGAGTLASPSCGCGFAMVCKRCGFCVKHCKCLAARSAGAPSNV